MEAILIPILQLRTPGPEALAGANQEQKVKVRTPKLSHCPSGLSVNSVLAPGSLALGCRRVNDDNHYYTFLSRALNVSILRERSQSFDKFFHFSKLGVLMSCLG